MESVPGYVARRFRGEGERPTIVYLHQTVDDQRHLQVLESVEDRSRDVKLLPAEENGSSSAYVRRRMPHLTHVGASVLTVVVICAE